MAACLYLGGTPAQAEGPLIGRVISADGDSVLIQPEAVGAKPLRLSVEPGKVPGDLSAGALVRLWSNPGTVAGGSGWHLAPQVGDRIGTLDGDRTGVRSRIGRSVGRGASGGVRGGGSGGSGQHGR